MHKHFFVVVFSFERRPCAVLQENSRPVLNQFFTYELAFDQLFTYESDFNQIDTCVPVLIQICTYVFAFNEIYTHGCFLNQISACEFAFDQIITHDLARFQCNLQACAAFNQIFTYEPGRKQIFVRMSPLSCNVAQIGKKAIRLPHKSLRPIGSPQMSPRSINFPHMNLPSNRSSHMSLVNQTITYEPTFIRIFMYESACSQILT